MFKMLLSNWRKRRLMKVMVREWYKATGGTCRYRFLRAGGCVEVAFSGPQCETLDDMAGLLESFCGALRAVKHAKPLAEEVNW